MKLALKDVFERYLASDEWLVTSLVEVEEVPNSRPLCKSCDDSRDDEGSPEAKTVETRPGKNNPAEGPNSPVLPSEQALFTCLNDRVICFEVAEENQLHLVRQWIKLRCTRAWLEGSLISVEPRIDQMRPPTVGDSLALEVEKVVNSRPLCKTSNDPSGDEVLTPNHFLRGTKSGVSASWSIRWDRPMSPEEAETSTNYG